MRDNSVYKIYTCPCPYVTVNDNKEQECECTALLYPLSSDIDKSEPEKTRNGGTNMTTFFMPMIPPTSTHQQVGHTIDKQGRHRFYQRGNGEAEAKLTAHLRKHIPEQPYTGAVQVVVKWCYPATGKHRSGEPYTNKPDVDNLCKAMYDIMTRLHYWNDDKQIYSAVTEKFWADVPGVFVKIEEAEEHETN